MKKKEVYKEKENKNHMAEKGNHRALRRKKIFSRRI